MVENKLNELSERVELISTKGFIKSLIYKYRIPNSGEYFGVNGLENYSVYNHFQDT